MGDLGVLAEYRPTETYGLLPGHTAEVRLKGDVLGVFGQVHPDTAAAFDIDEPLFLLELSIEDLVRAVPERPAYAPPSRFPEVRQDLALLVDLGMPAGRVLELVRAHRSGGVRLQAEVFDEYRGTGLPDGKKSLALRLRYQASDRTLSDDDVAKIQGGLMRRLEKELGASLRGG